MSDVRGVDDVVALLGRRGAQEIDHPGGTLLDHLVRTSGLLAGWGARPDLVVAGLAHAAYGTDGFGPALFGLAERALVAEALGERAEAIVYRYASCDRAFTLGRVGVDPEPRFRDRFTGEVASVDAAGVHDFAELTFANELDLAAHSPAFEEEHGAAVAALFRRWEHVVSAAAYEAFERALGAHRAGRGSA